MANEITEESTRQVADLKASIGNVVLALQEFEKRFEALTDGHVSDDIMKNYPMHMGTPEDMITEMQKWEAAL